MGKIIEPTIKEIDYNVHNVKTNQVTNNYLVTIY